MYIFWWLVGAVASKQAFVPVGSRYKAIFGSKRAAEVAP